MVAQHMEKYNHGTTHDCRTVGCGGSEDVVTIQDFVDSMSIRQVACWSVSLEDLLRDPSFQVCTLLILLLLLCLNSQ